MSSIATVLLLVALGLYATSTAAFVAHLVAKKPEMARRALLILVAGMGLHAVGKVLRFIELGTVPVTNSAEAVGLASLAVGFAFVYVARRYSVPVLGAFATPFVLVTLAASLAFGGGRDDVVPAALRSAWFPVHLAFAIGGDALFALAGIASVAYLVQERLLRKKKLGAMFRNMPPLHVLDEICHRMIAVGFLLMTMGIVAGMFYANDQWGTYFPADPKLIWSLMTWFLFAGILHARLTIGWQGRRAAYLTLVAVALVLLALFGLDVVTATRHGGEYR
jgi:cytochrome c-type biogenesis protein CcsB